MARVTEHARDHDATISAIVADRMQRRYDGMRAVVARIAAEDRLAHEWDIDTAAAFVWALTAPAAFHLLVIERGWTPQHWAHHTYRLLHSALIRPDAPPNPR